MITIYNDGYNLQTKISKFTSLLACLLAAAAAAAATTAAIVIVY